VGDLNGTTRQRGNIALYLLFSIAAAVAVGYSVYLVIRDHKLAVADDAVAEPAPARRVPRAEISAEPPPIAEPADQVDVAEAGAADPNVIVSARDAVLLGTPGVAGGLERDQVEQTVHRYTVRYERCMRRAKERGASPRGALRLTFVISAEGNVDYATGKPIDLDDELATCVVDVIKKLRFDRSSDGAKVKVVYPMAFVPASAGDPLSED
jgi:hypothetical protein